MEQNELPQIIFENFKITIALGKWLGIIPTLDHFHISKKILQIKNIQKIFGQILKQAGIDSNETCILTNFRKNDFSVTCELKNKNQKINIKLGLYYFRGIPYSTLSIKSPTETKNFNYLEATTEKPMELSLYARQIKNPETGNICEQRLYSSHIEFQIKSKDNRFSFIVNRVGNCDPEIFRLENEDELIKYFLNLTFPANISEIYQKIKEISGLSTDQYPSFNLSIEKANQRISSISINTMIDRFTMQKGNQTITVFHDNWSYHSNNISVSKKDKNIHCEIDATIDQPLSSDPHQHEIAQVVEQAKQFVKTL